MGHALRRAASQRIGGFDPLTVGWTHAYWAEGPEFVALGKSDGASMTIWPDEMSTMDLETTAGTPTYQSSGWASPARPSVRFPGSALMVRGWSQSQPFSAVVIADRSGGGAFSYYIGGAGTSGWAIYRLGASTLSGFAGSDVTATADSDAPHMLALYANGGSSALGVDGTFTSGSAGSNNPTVLSLGGRSDGVLAVFFAGDIVFAGVASGDIRTDPKWSQFKTWVTSHYGITVA